MPDSSITPRPPGAYSFTVRAALDLVEGLLVEGLKHGHFDYAVTCEMGTNGRRLLIVRAGKNHKFSIMEPEVPP